MKNIDWGIKRKALTILPVVALSFALTGCEFIDYLDEISEDNQRITVGVSEYPLPEASLKEIQDAKELRKIQWNGVLNEMMDPTHYLVEESPADLAEFLDVDLILPRDAESKFLLTMADGEGTIEIRSEKIPLSGNIKGTLQIPLVLDAKDLNNSSSRSYYFYSSGELKSNSDVDVDGITGKLYTYDNNESMLIYQKDHISYVWTLYTSDEDIINSFIDTL